MTNPLLQPLTLKDQALPFNEIKVENYIPAIQEAISEAKKNVELIKDLSNNYRILRGNI